MTKLMQFVRTLVLITMFSPLTSCYSMIRFASSVEVRGDGRVMTLTVWENVGTLNEHWYEDLAMSTVVYPLDILWSTVIAIDCAGNPGIEFRGGALGAVAAILLPGLTMFPTLKPFGPRPPPIELNDDEFRALMDALLSGAPIPHSEKTGFLQRANIDRIEMMHD